MKLILNGTQIFRTPIMQLVKLLSHDHEAFLQLLIELCNRRTFKRIIRCPTYPARIITQDLEGMRRLFCESIALTPFEVSHALAFLYAAAAERAMRKRQGQYFTPDYVARRAITFTALREGETLLDPGCGTGIFPLVLLRELAKESRNPVSLVYLGVENDPLLALSAAVSLDWVDAPSSWKILYANYLGVQSEDIEKIVGRGRKIDAIVSNPPFVRFQGLGERNKIEDKLNLEPYSGLHSFFLAHSSQLVRRGRMIFVVPTEMNGTRYGTSQLTKLKSKFEMKNEVSYYDARGHVWNTVPTHRISLRMHMKMKHAWNLMQFFPISDVKSKRARTHAPEVPKGAKKTRKTTAPLGSFVSVHRGISTGANRFFVIADKVAREIGISEEMTRARYLKKIVPTKIPKARLKSVFQDGDWHDLREEGRPCWLLRPPEKTPMEDLPSGLRHYLKNGESLGIHLIPTCRIREPWYHVRIPAGGRVPDLFFTYVSRGFPSFVYNKAGAYNLTNLLGIYLKFSTSSDREMEKLANLLKSELQDWINQEPVGRRYKGGMIKFEPKDLERMPVSVSELNDLQAGLGQLTLPITDS